MTVARALRSGLAPAFFAGLLLPAGDAAAAPEAPAFTGAYVGPEFGLHEHHFYIQETDPTRLAVRGRYYRSWGLGGGAFAGFDRALSSRLRLGAEAGISVGGTSPQARFDDGSYYVARPRYGYRVTARAGFAASDRVLAYATFGYGGHRYRIDSVGIARDGGDWGHSFTVGGGVEYRISDRLGLRLDFRHLDNRMSHLLLGLPVRF